MLVGGNAGSPLSPPWVSGRYYFTPNTLSLTTSAALGNGTLRCVPFYVPNPVTITRMGAEVTIVGDAGSKLRLGIYADDGTGRPGALLLDAGTIAGDSATVQEITGLSLALGPGWYHAAAAVQLVTVTQPTIRCPTAGVVPSDVGSSIPSAAGISWGMAQASVTGALPATFTGTSANGLIPHIFVKT